MFSYVKGMSIMDNLSLGNIVRYSPLQPIPVFVCVVRVQHFDFRNSVIESMNCFSVNYSICLKETITHCYKYS